MVFFSFVNNHQKPLEITECFMHGNFKNVPSVDRGLGLNNSLRYRDEKTLQIRLYSNENKYPQFLNQTFNLSFSSVMRFKITCNCNL